MARIEPIPHDSEVNDLLTPSTNVPAAVPAKPAPQPSVTPPPSQTPLAKAEPKAAPLQHGRVPEMVALQGIVDYIERHKAHIEPFCGQYIDYARLKSSFLYCLRTNEALGRCTNESLFRAVYKCARLGLYPESDSNMAHLIPYGTEAKFQIGYRGVQVIAERHPLVAFFAPPYLVYQGDEFAVQVIQGILTPIHNFRVPRKEGISVIAGYQCCRLKDGPTLTIVLERKDFDHRMTCSKRVQAYEKKKAEYDDYVTRRDRSFAEGKEFRDREVWEPAPTAWHTDYDAMCKKTLTIELGKRIPPTPELAMATSIVDDEERSGE